MPDGQVRGMPSPTKGATVGGLLLPDRIYHPQGNEIIADEFDDASIHPDWARVDASSSSYVTWTESGGVMSAFHNSNASAGGYWHALCRPLPSGQSYPVTIETYVSGTVAYNVSYLMYGLAFSDGLALSGTNQIVAMPYHHATSAGSMLMSLRDFDNWMSNITSWQYPHYGSTYQGFYLQLRWTAANTFSMRTSSDGVNWVTFSNQTATLTPTYVAIINTNWGGAYAYQVGYEYLRVYASSDPIGIVDTL